MDAHSRLPVTWRDGIRQARHRHARARRRFVLLRRILSPVQAFRSALAGESARTSRGKLPVGEGEGPASMRALRTARGGHHVPGAESANRQCRIPLSRGASGVIHIWSDAPVIPIAAVSSAGDAGPMAKKRQPIDDLIDALVWMRRTSKRRARRSAVGGVRQQAPDKSGPSGKNSPLRIVTNRAEPGEARYRPQSAAVAR
jgi:hypothetical protein